MEQTCKPIEGLVLDKPSQDALKRIRNHKQVGKWIGALVSIGVLHNILAKDRLEYFQIPHDISQTEWKLYVTTMASLPQLVRNAIEREAEALEYHYEMENNLKLRDFWRGIAYGCK